MSIFRSPSTALLIKDQTRNIFYELEDPRDVQDRCVIKIYCKEPVYGTYPGHHNPHLANGDLRVSAQPHFHSSFISMLLFFLRLLLEEVTVIGFPQREIAVAFWYICVVPVQTDAQTGFTLHFSFITNSESSCSLIWSEIRT